MYIDYMKDCNIFDAHITIETPTSGQELTALHSIRANSPVQAEIIARFKIEALLRKSIARRGAKVVRIDIVPGEQFPVGAYLRPKYCRYLRT